MSDRARYLELVSRHPQLFINPPKAAITIELEPQAIEHIERVVAQKLAEQSLPPQWADVGVAYEDQYMLLLRDAVYLGDGTPGTYLRFVSEEATPGVIILPVVQEHVVLINHFRHATRAWHLEIPRGFGLPRLTSEENARRELSEEIGAEAIQLVALGRAHTDTGMSMECNDFFLAHIENYKEGSAFEGIKDIQPIPVTEFERLIRDEVITDNYTMIAYTRAKLRGLL